MRGEIVRLVLSLSLIGGAFLAGMYVGWRKWGLRPEPVHPGVRFTAGDAEAAESVAASDARRDLFTPANDVVDLRFAPSALPSRSVVSSERSLPRGSLTADEIVTYRSAHDPRRAD